MLRHGSQPRLLAAAGAICPGQAARYPVYMDRENGGNAEQFDVLIVGAGPTGLACGIDVKRAGLSVVNIDKGCLVNSLFNYPSNMTFFTTPELLEIGDMPFSSPEPEAQPPGGAGILPQSRGALSTRCPPVSACTARGR